MKFAISGADRETGEDLDLVVEAPDERTALGKAQKRGILVASCKPESSVSSTRTSHQPSTRRSGQRPMRFSFILLATIVVVVAILYVAWIRPQNMKLAKTLEDTIAQNAKNEAMAKEQAERQLAEEQERLRLAEEERVRAATAQAAQAQANAVIRSYINSAEGFVREVKALKGRVSAGTNFQEFTDKLLVVMDEYAQIETLPDDVDAVEFSKSARRAMDHYQQAQQTWANAIRNNTWVGQKYRIREIFDIADSEITLAISSFNLLKTKNE